MRDKSKSSFKRNSKDIDVFEKVVPDMKAEGLNVELKSMGWHLVEKSKLTLERQKRVLGAAESEYEFAAIRRALSNSFMSHVTDRRTNDRFRNRFRKPRDGKTGRHTAYETGAHVADEDPNSEEEESCEEESDVTAAFEREVDELASVVEELEDASEKICENFQSPCMRDSPPSERHTKS